MMTRERIHAATSFGSEGIKLYAVNMISSFIQHWPHDVILKVYLDDMTDAEKLPRAQNVEYVLLNHPDLVAFKKRHANDPYKHGIKPGHENKSHDRMKSPVSEGYSFLMDAVRFAHKVFAVYDCAMNGPDIVIWLDGDSRTFAGVSKQDILSWIPEGKFAGFLERPKTYTETGFHIFDMSHPYAIKFFKVWTDFYRNDSVFNLTHWTDCHTYDAARRSLDRSAWHSLSPSNQNISHVFINGPLGKFMDHMKGARKLKGRSNKTDLGVERTEEYWRNQ